LFLFIKKSYVKQELRKASALKINYSTKAGNQKQVLNQL